MSERRWWHWFSGRSVSWLIMVFAVAYLLSAKYSPMFTNKPDDEVEVMELVAVPNCDPVGTVCNAVGGSTAIGLKLSSPVKPLVPFNATVSVQGVRPGQIDSVKINFVMVDMDMGRNLYDLVRHDNAFWHGAVTLPVCTSQRTDWVAEVFVRVGDRLYQAHFPFQS